MQLLLDFLPVIAFFAAYKLAGIYVATGVMIVAVIVQVSIAWLRHRRVSPMLLLSAGLVLVFGGLTLLIHDKAFIMWKPTVLNWLLALACLASALPAFGGRPLVQRMMEAADAQLKLGAADWKRLNLVWALFFGAVGFANLIAFRTLDEATWVDFKLFGLLGLTLVFAIAQGVWIASRAQAVAGDPS